MSRDPASPPDLAFGPFRLERVAGRLLREGESVGLPPRLWAVLRHLVERPGHLVGKDELLDAVWGHRHVSESVLKSTMNSLRGKLGDDAAAPRYIETVPRRGYRFIAAVQASERDHTDAGSVAPPSIPAPASPAPAVLPAHRNFKRPLESPCQPWVGGRCLPGWLETDAWAVALSRFGPPRRSASGSLGLDLRVDPGSSAVEPTCGAPPPAAAAGLRSPC
ncbi:MAG: transcriptional regulator [Burkholderiales bacterium]|nr:transcriptional regulator [Burkholderiales bacterium]